MIGFSFNYPKTFNFLYKFWSRWPTVESTLANFPKAGILKYGFCKKLLRYKWTSDQLNIFFLTFWGQKCSTGQRFTCTEVTSYKIHTLECKKIEFLLVYDRNHYFGFGPIPKPKPKLVDTFGRYRNRYRNHISKGKSSYQ